MYLFWNLAAGTSGFFGPFIIRTVGHVSQATSVGVSALGGIIGLLITVAVFMPLNDRMDRRKLFGVGAAAQVVAYLLFAIFPLTLPIALANVVLSNMGSAVAQYPLFRIWSAELFPTPLRSSAQGMVYGFMRIILGGWSLVVPTLVLSGFRALALMLSASLLLSGLIGFLFAPGTQGKSLEMIERERLGTPGA
jgi:inositol transporter-like SP family MFS transporter